jgi:hypothetical protein
MFKKSNLVYVAEDLLGVKYIDWFIEYCTEYHPNLVWYCHPTTYCCPNDAYYLAGTFKNYLNYLEESNPKLLMEKYNE